MEPWHGNEVVVYTEKGGQWQRRVIFDKVASGHEVAVLDLNGDGRDDVVANDNSRPSQNNPNAPTGGVHVFYAPEDAATGTWQYQRIEESAAMNGCVGVDMNGDRRRTWSARAGAAPSAGTRTSASSSPSVTALWRYAAILVVAAGVSRLPQLTSPHLLLDGDEAILGLIGQLAGAEVSAAAGRASLGFRFADPGPSPRAREVLP